MKFGQIPVCCMTNISNMFLAQCSRLFLIVDHLPFLNVPYSPSQKNETLESRHNWLLSNWGSLLNWKGPGTYPQSSKLFNRFVKIIIPIYIYQLAKFVDLMSCGSKDKFKKYTLFHVLILIMTSQIW